ncbi:MAG: thiol protease/hemagglutinin PrtT [Bacteroidales bacterium]|nr:thiol protease/hemagglutinin PrtT [Bacteroidales bacterium]
MKRLVCSVLTAVAMIAAPMVQAENVSVDQAKDAAAHYLQHNTTFSRITAEQLTLSYQWNNETLGIPSMYLFTAPTQGWIIMAATTVIHPVVAYTDEEVFDGRMAPAQEAWLNDYNEMVCEYQNFDNEKGLDDSPEWKMLSSHSLKGSKASVYLLKTRWDQGGSSGTDYNIFSPVIDGSVAPTGCVATALAQICYYYKFPVKPKGTVVYYNSRDNNARMAINFDTVPSLDYSIMPLEVKVSTTQERREQVSRLAFYVGMSVKMQFGSELSGSTDVNARSGMRNNMKYTLGTIVSRRSSGNDTSFIGTVRRDLLRNRPLYMSGSSDGTGEHASGHAWVCDGYNDNDTSVYHMNWGWGGVGNAFYNLVTNNLTISGQGYNFRLNQSVITNMIPPADSTDVPIVGVDEVEDNTLLGSPYPNPATLSVTLPYSTLDAAELQVYSVSGRLVESRRVEAGDGAVTLRVDALPAGVYVYRMGDAYGKFVVR